MITNFYTLRALVDEWRGRLLGMHLVDAFSQEKGELTLAFARAPERESDAARARVSATEIDAAHARPPASETMPNPVYGAAQDDGTEMMIRLSVVAPMPFIFRVDGYSRARRNVANLFAAALEKRVLDLRIADRDRMIYIDLEGDAYLQIMLFGPRANVFFVASAGVIVEAFRNSEKHVDHPAPAPRAAPDVADFAAFLDRWRIRSASVERALSAAFPLLDRAIARETAIVAGIDPDAAPDLTDDDARRLFDRAREVEARLLDPHPAIYWEEREPVQFSLLPLSYLPSAREERFEHVDAAVAVYVKSSLAQRHFERLYRPVEKALADAAEHYTTSAERMLDELSSESRAGRYEHYGHLLMANLGRIPTGAEEVELEDLFAGREPVQIKLDPAKSAVENARNYYDRARRTRRSREEAERRLIETEEAGRRARALLEELRGVEGLKGIRDFRSERASELSRFLSSDSSPEERVPFRRYDLGAGYEVWVGRNARQNDALTFRHARKYDLWMHARGVPGSHAVLRLPNRDAVPGRLLLQQAAAIAAYHSKARGSGLVPVIVAERKFVRKPKGAGPGAVAVDREDVLLVEPKLPPGAGG